MEWKIKAFALNQAYLTTLKISTIRERFLTTESCKLIFLFFFFILLEEADDY